MSKISIIVDSTCDLNVETMKRNNIIFAPLGVEIDGHMYHDKIDITAKEFYEKIRKKDTFPKTSLVSPATFEDLFKKELDKGNDVLCITLSSNLSGTYNSANIAKNVLESDKVHIIDSKTSSLGCGMLVLAAINLVKEGYDINFIKDVLNNIISNQMCMIYVEDMEMLKRGGRVSNVAASLGSVLKIKPILTTKDGSVVLHNKVRGKKAGFKEIVRTFERETLDKKYPIMVAHANNIEGASELISLLGCVADGMDVLISEIGPAVGTHSGEGAIAIWGVKK